MQPQMAKAIEKATRRDFPDGIPSYGTDALRFAFCALASTGRDVRFDLKRIEGYRNFCNKLWNATKFVLMNTEGATLAGPVGGNARRSLDRIATEADAGRCGTRDRHVSVRSAREHHLRLRVARVLRLVPGTDQTAAVGRRRERRGAARHAALAAQGARDCCCAPRTRSFRSSPKTLWRRVAPLTGIAGETIMVAPYPEAAELADDPVAEAAIEWLKGVVLAVRTIRGEMNIKPGQTMTLLLQGGGSADRERLAATESLLKRMAKLDRDRMARRRCRTAAGRDAARRRAETDGAARRIDRRRRRTRSARQGNRATPSGTGAHRRQTRQRGFRRESAGRRRCEGTRARGGDSERDRDAHDATARALEALE